MWVFVLAALIFIPFVVAQGPVLVSPDNNIITNDKTPYFSWQILTDATENYRIVICHDLNGAPNPSDNIYDNWTTENYDNFDLHPENALPDGFWWWGVRVENVPGATQVSDWTWYCLTVDTVAPSVTVDLPPYVNSSNVTSVQVTLSSNENGTYTVSVDDQDPNTAAVTQSGTISAGQSLTLTFNLSSLSDGTLTATAQVTDAAGNIGTATDTAIKDTVAPQVVSVELSDNLISDNDVGTFFRITITYSEAMDNTVNPNIVFIPDVSTTLQNPTFSWSTDNTILFITYTIYDANVHVDNVSFLIENARDLACNLQLSYLKENAFSIDTLNPVVWIDLPNYVNLANVSQVVLYFGSNENGTYQILLDDENTETPPIERQGVIVGGTVDNLILDLSGLSDGTINATIMVLDLAGNAGENTDHAVKDTVRPSASVKIEVAYFINSENVKSVRVFISSNEVGDFEVVIDDEDPATGFMRWSGSIGAGIGLGSVFNLSGLSDGRITARAAVCDRAGNVTEVSDTKIKDATAPTGSIVINAGADYTNSTSVTLTLTASDALSGVSQMSFSNDGINWSDWEPFMSTKSWTLTARDGTKTVYVKFKDGAGNVSSAYSDTIVLDTTPPSPPSLSGVLGAASPTATGWSFTSVDPSLTLVGTVEPGCRVYINEVPVPVSANGSFSKALSLVPGPNRFTLRIVDRAGNITTRILDVYHPARAVGAAAPAPTLPSELIFALCAIALIGAGMFAIFRR